MNKWTPHYPNSTAGSGPTVRCAGRSSSRHSSTTSTPCKRVGEHAESKDHHPDIDIRWRTVTFALVTHSEGGITDKDVQMARDIDGILA